MRTRIEECDLVEWLDSGRTHFRPSALTREELVLHYLLGTSELPELRRARGDDRERNIEALRIEIDAILRESGRQLELL